MKRRILILLIPIFLIAIVYLFGWSSFLSISSVSIQTKDPKNIQIIESQLRQSGQEIRIGEPLARINTRAVERSLKSQPWIGSVRIERNWIDGKVSLLVKERIPLLRIERMGSGTLNPTKIFMTAEGVIFELPGNLSDAYQTLPILQLRGNSRADRVDAVKLFDAVNPKFPITKMHVTGISRFITESDFDDRAIRVTWGVIDELETKILVLEELLALKENRNAVIFDVSDPQLPVVNSR